MIALTPQLIKSRKWLGAAERTHYHAPRFAERVCMNLRTLQRRFRNDCGCTITDWLNVIRLRCAMTLARQPMPAAKIAHQLHSKSVPSFAREFKRVHGMSVTEFREGLQRKRKRAR